MKVLIAAPIHNRAWILPDYLQSIRELDAADLEISYLFLENDSTDDSGPILRDTTAKWKNCAVESVHNDLPPYDRSGLYADPMYMRMAQLRERIRLYAVEGGFDWLFNCDSDILCQPCTLRRLLAHDLDMVAAMISNSGTALFSAVNAAEWRAASGPGPYNTPARWFKWVPTGKAVCRVGGTGACFVASRAILAANTYFYRPATTSLYWIPPNAPGHIYGEDYAFAMCCGDNGYHQHLDETLRNWHCYTPELLAIYQAARRRYRKNAVRTIADRAWAGVPKELLVPGCLSCGPSGKGLYE